MSQEKVAPLNDYFIIWAALLALLALTCGSAYVPLGFFNGVINLGIAAIKALLVMVFFMQLKSDRPVIRIFAGAAFLWLAILMGLSLVDFLARPQTAVP